MSGTDGGPPSSVPGPGGAKYERLVATMAQGVVYQDGLGRIVDANPAACEILGLSLDQMLGRESVDPRWCAIREDGSPFPGEEHPAMVTLRTGVPTRGIMGVFNPRLEAVTWISVSARPEFDEGPDRPSGVYTTFEDVTELRQAQESLAASERALRERNTFIESILARIPLGVAVSTMDTGEAQAVNAQFAEIYGWPAELLQDVETFFERVYPDPQVRARMRGRILGDIESGDPDRMRWIGVEVVGQDGQRRYVDAANIPLPEQNRMISTVSDATERVQAEWALRKLEWMLTAGSGATDATVFEPGGGDPTAASSAGPILATIGRERLAELVGDYLDLLGTTSAVYEADGSSAFGIFASGWYRLLYTASRAPGGAEDDVEASASGRRLRDESCWAGCSHRAIESGEPVDMECLGGVRSYAEPIFAGGRVIGAVSFGYGDPPTDAETLDELAVRLGVDRAVLEREARRYDSRPPFIVALAKRRLHTTARLIGAMMERARAEAALQERLKELRCLHELSRLIRDPNLSTSELLRRAVALVPPAFQHPEHTGARIRLGDTTASSGEIEAADALLEVELRVRGERAGEIVVALRGAPAPLEGEDPFLAEERTLMESFAEQLGSAIERSESEAYRDALVTCSPVALHSQTLDGTITAWNAAAARTFGWQADEVVGRSLPTLPESQRLQFEALRRKVGEGESVHGVETTRVTRDGRTLPCEVSLAPTLGPQGRVTGMVVATQDLSERQRHQDEIRDLERRLFQSEKLDSVGRLAGGVAHDFNNMLTVINSFARMVLDGLHAVDPIRQDVQQILSAGERAASLTRQLLAFSRRQVLEPVVLDLNEVIGGLDRILRRLIGEDIEIRTALAPNLSAVEADRAQIEQVVMNLVLNARDAMPNGGRLTIETANVVLDEEYAAKHPEVVPGRHVRVAITDTGAGIPLEIQPRIFDPFFTTKETGRGTGLGLATVFGIVKQSGGHIWLYSEVGRGSTFKVYLPITDAVPGPRQESSMQLASGGSETLLVVEDEDAVLTLVSRVLTSAGYRVVAAPNAGAALLHCEREGSALALLLTDVVMPTMNGPELARRVAALVPGIRVLYMSGYTENAIVHHGVLDPGTHFIGKPFEPKSLLQKVREVLDAPSVAGTDA